MAERSQQARQGVRAAGHGAAGPAPTRRARAVAVSALGRRRVARPDLEPDDGAPTAALVIDDVVSLQRDAGNRAVAEALAPAVQRVPVKVKTGETLYNQEGTGGKAGAKHYGGSTRTYDLTRNGDSSVTATVKIKFLNQARNTVPKPADAPEGTPELGQLVGDPTEIPAGDDRTWAETMAAKAVAHWNGKLALVGEEWNALRENTKKRLPVTFRAEACFGLDDEAHATVIAHPPSVVGGAKGHPIDAGNWYMKKNDQKYPASEDIIYAHEYGHLLGIADEYSQSNEQMNALLHEAAPANAASSLAALDKATIERMTLAALARPLAAQLGAAMPSVTDAIRAKRPLVKARMAKAAREAATGSGVRGQLRDTLETGTVAALGPRVPATVAFQTTTNFSNRSLAAEGVEAGFSAGALATQISDAYWKALTGAQDPAVAVKGIGDVRINVQSSVYDASAAGSAIAGNAGAVATSAVGSAATPGLPAVAPSGSLMAELSALPTTWSTAGSSLEAGVTAPAFAAKMEAALRGARAARDAAEAALPSGSTPDRAASTRALYELGHRLVTNAAREAARQLATDLVAAAVNPVLNASVASLQGTIATEVGRLGSAKPGTLAAAPPDPNMAAVVASMKSRLDAAKQETKDTGRDPLGAEGGTAPDQDVTYSYQGLMGSNKTAEVRADQFKTLVDAFNASHRTLFEKSFSAEAK